MINQKEKIQDHILDSIGEGVFTVDKTFRINFFNKAAEKITGFNKEEVLGKFCKHVFKSDLCFLDCPISIVLRNNKNIYDFEAKIVSKDGERKPIRLNSAVLYNEENEPTGGVISFRDQSEVEAFRKSLEKDTNFYGIIGHSKAMKEIFELIKEISESDAPVLIHGESGTGKELVANAIQKSSRRNSKEFVKVNCSVFPDNLLASELFGHVKGAFTDAHKDRLGRFELANEGTIFLDEIAEMPIQMQSKLLRVLQEGTFERVGESITRSSDVRIISATNINIDQALKKGSLREDLYYRLSVIPIEVPPLRERTEDIIPLINHFISKFAIIYKKELKELDDNALETLMNYNWPGNVRELENTIEYAFVRTNGATIHSSKLPAIIRNYVSNSSVKSIDECVDKNCERTELLKILNRHKWNKTKVAQELKVGRTTLWRKMKRLGLAEE
jgi:PAS domain S-box-containing protein